MNARLDKRTYNDARYGADHYGRAAVSAVVPKVRRHGGATGSGLRRGTRFALGAPGAIFIAFSMLYGGHAEWTMRAPYHEISHTAFTLAFADISWLASLLGSFLGMESNPFLNAILDMTAVVAAMAFAFFAGAGAAVICLYQAAFSG